MPRWVRGLRVSVWVPPTICGLRGPAARCWATGPGSLWLQVSQGRQQGLVFFLLQVKRSRSKGGLAGPDGTKSVFGQMCAKMSSFSPDSLLLPHRVWKVKFVGESARSQGGRVGVAVSRACCRHPPGCSHSLLG